MKNPQTLRTLKTTTAILTLSFSSFLTQPLYAQEARQTPSAVSSVSADDIQEQEVIVVTGSFIKRKSQENSPSPLNVMSTSDISSVGFNNVGDLARTMTFNAGSELSTDAFTQNFSTGTSNVNLRGLGLSSTLVLLNGKRQTLSAAYADDGSTFVDTSSLMPLIMVERIETLKDGGSALYGTDAVSGVVNYISRKDFTGLELEGRFQSTTADSQRDYDISAIWGTEVGDNGNFVIAANFLHRESLQASERPELTSGTGVSGSGQPGTYILLDRVPQSTGVGGPNDQNNNGLSDQVPIIDPYCGTAPNSIQRPTAGAPPLGALTVGSCAFQFDSFYDLVPEEDRVQLFASFDTEVGDNMNFYMEGGYTNNKAERRNAPSFPIASPLPVGLRDPGTGAFFDHVPAEIQAIGTALGVTGVTDTVFIGRALGANGQPFISEHNNDTFRIAATLDGQINTDWTWELSSSYSKNNYDITVDDIKRDEYINALITGAWNPFGTAHTTHPNSAEALENITAHMTLDGETSLFTTEGHVTGDLFEFNGNMIQIAIGAQYRREKMDYDWSDDYNGSDGQGSNTGNLAGINGGNLMFLYGGPDYGGDRDVFAGFTELAVPLHDTLDLQLAARYEDYGSGINSFDPKVSLLWRPDESLSVRGSFSTAFRAPSLYNTLGVQTALNEITLGTTSTFLPVRSTGNPNLQPEEADVYNIGFTWNATDEFQIGMDYWRYDFTNLITQENSQSIVNRAAGGDLQALSQLNLSTPGDLSTLFLIDTNIINAPTVTTDGMDFTASYRANLANTDLSVHSSFQATYVFKYDAVDQAGNAFDGAGNRNFTNFARSIPEWRANYNLGVSNDQHAANIFVRYIDGYLDDQNDAQVPSYTTVDLQYAYTLGDPDEMATRFTLGVINLFDKEVPRLNTNGGFDSKVHDPRGRMVYLKVNQSF